MTSTTAPPLRRSRTAGMAPVALMAAAGILAVGCSGAPSDDAADDSVQVVDRATDETPTSLEEWADVVAPAMEKTAEAVEQWGIAQEHAATGRIELSELALRARLYYGTVLRARGDIREVEPPPAEVADIHHLIVLAMNKFLQGIAHGVDCADEANPELCDKGADLVEAGDRLIGEAADDLIRSGVLDGPTEQ